MKVCLANDLQDSNLWLTSRSLQNTAINLDHITGHRGRNDGLDILNHYTCQDCRPS